MRSWRPEGFTRSQKDAFTAVDYECTAPTGEQRKDGRRRGYSATASVRRGEIRHLRGGNPAAIEKTMKLGLVTLLCFFRPSDHWM